MKIIMLDLYYFFTKKAYLRETLPQGKFDKNNTHLTKLVKILKSSN